MQPLLTEVAPPELGLRALAGEVQPPQSGGGTAWGSVSEPDSSGATAPDREVQPPGLSPRALLGGATSPVRRCNRLIPEFRDLIVLSSKFELGWGL